MRHHDFDENATREDYLTASVDGAMALIHSPHCQHCKAMINPWNGIVEDIPKFKDEFADGTSLIRLHSGAIDNICGGEEGKWLAEEFSKKVSGVPTIIIIQPGGKLGEAFNGKRTKEAIVDFLKKK